MKLLKTYRGGLFGLGAAVVAAVGLIGSSGCDKASPKSAQAAAPVRIPLVLSDAYVIGASVSAGCEASLPGFPPAELLEVKGHADLAGVLGAVTNGAAPGGAGDVFFFMTPSATAQKQLEAAKAANPKVVFAVDYLFWHGYGAGMKPAARMKKLDEGLERLDSLACPMVIGDFPDMSHAIGILLDAKQVPDMETIGKLNARVRDWASTRPRVVVVPLFETVGKAIKSESVTFGGKTFEGAQARGMLTASGLHVTPDGLIALAYESLNQLRDRGLIAPNSSWETDSSVVLQRLVDAKKAAMAK